MGNALRMGLAGGLMGAMAGAYDQWQNTQQEIKTERLRAARKLESEALAKIAAENEAAKDAREHGQALEIEGVKSKTRAELEASKEAERSKRAAADRASREAQAAAARAARIEAAKIGASRPRGESTKARPVVLVPNSGQGESVAWEPGTPFPTGYTVPNDPRFRAQPAAAAKPLASAAPRIYNPNTGTFD
jgi:hypothetical protein